MEKAPTSSVQTSLISREIAHLAFVQVKQDDWLKRSTTRAAPKGPDVARRITRMGNNFSE